MNLTKHLARLGAASLFLAMAASPALAETNDAPAEARLNAVNAALLYHQVSGEPAPVANMMTKPLNMRFDNEFERRRFTKENFPAFQKMAEDVMAQPAYYTKFSVRLGDYDFTDERFPINGIYSGSMYFNYDADKAGSEGMDYAVRIVNTDEIKFLDMAPDDAEALLNRVEGNKISAQMWMVPVTPVSAGWIKMKNSYYRTVQMKATVLKLFDPNGELIAEIESKTPNLKNKARPVKHNPISEPTFSNPWTAEDAPTAILDHYQWYIQKKYQVADNGSSGDAFQNAVDMRGVAAEGCTTTFGYSECKRLMTARRQMMDRCTASVAKERVRECYMIDDIPYTTEEADSYSNRTSD
ncbi:DUF4852 domain-containing protein [Hyphomonas pacifica]|uniref:DUF4852 domain-containing protein n=1 Tax=Hyphomonas pacifica TaxID=1280941 RepID=A0A062TYE8_9PROT|nr:DUF4852 domain-containing protein [Hyphomonas pacifica]KCZ46839.1 hypothetical protein HY2_05495 [Hyphomonas pacifica]MBR9806573.1 DUF4852 domain-containing protein [Alphaproteobacteria bacterium]RAN30456.1 hypothetical protein HY3_06470 [Hyphomonas pacifica]